ncbi:hypothetical protein ACYQR9_03995 [Methylobacterium sp. CM6241]
MNPYEGDQHRSPFMPASSSDFGRYLQSVQERDVDLLLMEEFHVVPAFAEWFAKQVGLGLNAVFDGAWHSLNDQHGETDLLLRVRIGLERVAVLIENKVGAPEQDEQDVRYHLRGVRSQEAGRYDRFVTCMCAPQIYLDALPAHSAYEHRVPYEAIREWFATQEGLRTAWRRAIMDEAIEQGRRGSIMQVHAGKTAFHRAYWEHLQAHHPILLMEKPGPKGPKSDWMRFKASGFPKKTTLNHKNNSACMDLEFQGTLKTDVIAQRQPSWPEDLLILQTGKSTVLRLSVPQCDMELPFQHQIDKVDAALVAAHKLVPLARVMLEPPV